MPKRRKKDCDRCGLVPKAQAHLHAHLSMKRPNVDKTAAWLKVLRDLTELNCECERPVMPMITHRDALRATELLGSKG